MSRASERAFVRRHPFNFTCEHCGREVPWAQFQGEPKPRNHCPFCLWSKHVNMGEQTGYPPCNGMMKGTDVGGGEVVWRCLGCGFMMRGPTDDAMAQAAGQAGLRRSDAVGNVLLYRKPEVEHDD